MKTNSSSTKLTPESIYGMKGKRLIPALTAYDYPTAKILDECGIPLILVGDSVGMVVLGYPDTTHVTMEEMEHHLRAVARVQPKACIVADLPYRSYDDPDLAVTNARRLIHCGAQAVKAEGGKIIRQQIHAIRQAGIPFLGHLGMLPQHILEEGAYRKKGKTEAQREALLEDAQCLEEEGAFGMVLELVESDTAQRITSTTNIPTIGIGSGPHCDGQILVTHDLLGLFPWFQPKFVNPHFNAAIHFRQSIERWKSSLERSHEGLEVETILNKESLRGIV